MKTPLLSRRHMLAGFVLASSTSLLGLWSGTAKAALAYAQPTRLQTLTALMRDAFPHDALSPAFYESIAKTYMRELEKSSQALAELDRGFALLDGSLIAPFAELPMPVRRSLIARYDQEPFFKAVLWRGSELIYRNPDVWKVLGYGGSSIEDGGYLERGFDDIAWLPVK